MAKSGKARVPSFEGQENLFTEILRHRHPEKNTAIMQISFKLGLRAQEIALMEIKEVAELGRKNKHAPRLFKLNEIATIPAAITKGADALGRSKAKYNRKSVSFKVEVFDQVVKQIEALAKAGAAVDPKNFYPPVVRHKGRSRDLPMVDSELRKALEGYLRLRLDKDPEAKAGDPLFITQKGGAYSPNTLQEHMALMLRNWAGIEKASSHSGRRTLLTNIIHEQKEPLKTAQNVAGHVNGSTTLEYADTPEAELSRVLKKASKRDTL